jgi:hypothetical protein
MESAPVPTGPTRREQAACGTLDELRALFERYGAEPFSARRRAEHIIEARERRRKFGRTLKRIYRRKQP